MSTTNMEDQEQRRRSHSTGHGAHLLNHSPGPHMMQSGVSDRPPSAAIDYAVGSSYPSVDISQSHQYSQSTGADANLFVNQQLDQAIRQGYITPSLSPRSSYVSETQQVPNQLEQGQDPASLNQAFPVFQNNHQVQNPSQGQTFESLLLDSSFQGDCQQNNQSINPADLMGDMSSPPSPHPPQLNRGPSLNSQMDASFNQLSFHSPRHSPRVSLDPSSAALLQGQQITDWTSMLQGPSFRGHRRAPSENSDISSVAPSPYMPNLETFESIEQQHSPLLTSQHDSNMYQDGLGIEQVSLSDPVTHQRFSPGASPHMSPRILPSNGMSLHQLNGFLPQQRGLDAPYNGGLPSEGYLDQKPDPPPTLQHMNGSGGLLHAAQVSTPEINIEFAAPLKQQNLEPSKPIDDGNALTPPERGRKGRMRAKSDSYLGGSPMSRPMESRTPSPSPSSNGRQSLSPHDIRAVSPGKSSRRSSTSSIPNRDYILDLADPQRPGSSASDSRRVQKHPATFQCTLCPKRFTRAYNLRSHLRTHTDERPFVCTVCGKAFARQHDRRRHEGLHSGEKRFVCKGELKAGGAWGCGRRFARADALGRHFRSEAGRVCIKPLLDEENMQRRRHHAWNDQQGLSLPSSSSSSPSSAAIMAGGSVPAVPTLASSPMDPSQDLNAPYMLPQAILAQYPALANLSWDTLGLGGADDNDISGRSSYDASSGGEYYDDEPEGSGYVSGPGTEYGSSGGGGGGGGDGWGGVRS